MKSWTVRAKYMDKNLKKEKRNGVFFAMFDVRINVFADTIEEAIREAHTYLGTDYEIESICYEDTRCNVNPW